MSIQTLSPIDIRKLGLEALEKTLGPIGMVRFLQQYEGGVGDYTRERERLLKGLSVKDIIEDIKEKRKVR
ncbi:MAG: hypothetical protein HZA07_04125 [Nitrospirae bacterium]|nr:hypothetical protein [Nitrospirota bacterium]